MKKNNWKELLLLIIILVAVTTYLFFNVQGSGNVIKEKRLVTPFHSIEMKCKGTIIISQDKSESIEITADDNILGLINTNIENGVLKIHESRWLRKFKELTIEVQVKDLNNIVITGPGIIKSKGQFKTKRLNILTQSGLADLDINVEKLTSDIYNSSKLVLSGKANMHNVNVYNKAILDAGNLDTEVINIRTYSDEDCYVKANFGLNAHINGDGNIEYTGSAQLNVKVKGTGSLEMN